VKNYIIIGNDNLGKYILSNTFEKDAKIFTIIPLGNKHDNITLQDTLDIEETIYFQEYNENFFTQMQTLVDELIIRHQIPLKDLILVPLGNGYHQNIISQLAEFYFLSSKQIQTQKLQDQCKSSVEKKPMDFFDGYPKMNISPLLMPGGGMLIVSAADKCDSLEEIATKLQVLLKDELILVNDNFIAIPITTKSITLFEKRLFYKDSNIVNNMENKASFLIRLLFSSECKNYHKVAHLLQRTRFAHASHITDFKLDPNGATIQFNKGLNEDLLRLLNWVFMRWMFCDKNTVCAYTPDKFPQPQVVKHYKNSAIYPTQYDTTRTSNYDGVIIKDSINTVLDDKSVGTAIGTFAKIYGNPKPVDSFFKKNLDISTGQPGFKPFFAKFDNFSDSIIDKETDNYAKYNTAFPGEKDAALTAKFLQAHGLLSNKRSLSKFEVVQGNGSTQLFAILMAALLGPGDIVLMPRPTYGLFVDAVYSAKGEIGFIDLDDRGKLTPAALLRGIELYSQILITNYVAKVLLPQLARLNSYLPAKPGVDVSLQKLPCLPERLDHKSLQGYVKQINSHLMIIINKKLLDEGEILLPEIPSIRAFFHTNPHNPSGTVYTQYEIDALEKVLRAYPEISIIDDLAHYGIFLSEVDFGNFAKIEQLKNPIVTLFTLSKAFCQANMRAAFAFGSVSMIIPLQIKLNLAAVSISHPAATSLKNMFETTHLERMHYLELNNKEYRMRKNLINLLVCGSERCMLTTREKQEANQQVYSYAKRCYPNHYEDILAKLLTGLAFFDLKNDPAGSFFYLLGIDKLIGLRIGSCQLNSAMDVHNALSFFSNITSIPSELYGDIEKYSLRLSYSISQEDLFESFLRLHDFILLLREEDGKLPKETKTNLDKIKTLQYLGPRMTISKMSP
jgi:aspartate/methionine/tyrosine aminotransferase